MTDDKIKNKQKETLENLKKYNKERNTEIIDDRSMASVEEVTELQNEVSNAISSPKLTLVEREESFTTEDPSEFSKIEVKPYSEDDDENDQVTVSQEFIDKIRNSKVNYDEHYEDYLEMLDNHSKELHVEEVAELQNEVSSMLAANEQKERSRELIEARQEEIEHLHLTKDDFNEWGEPDPNRPRPNRFVPHICEFCGVVAYANQIHGMGYCKEKTQYES